MFEAYFLRRIGIHYIGTPLNYINSELQCPDELKAKYYFVSFASELYQFSRRETVAQLD
jgi:hypothetical protein